MNESPPEITGKRPSQTNSSWKQLFLNRADQTAFSILWVAVIIGCGWYFVTARGIQPIDIDQAEPQSTQFLVEVNSASEHEFACLPGIGKKTATSIISFREEKGPFKSVESLLNVPRFSQKTLDSVRPFLYVDSQDQSADR